MLQSTYYHVRKWSDSLRAEWVRDVLNEKKIHLAQWPIYWCDDQHMTSGRWTRVAQMIWFQKICGCHGQKHPRMEVRPICWYDDHHMMWRWWSFGSQDDVLQKTYGYGGLWSLWAVLLIIFEVMTDIPSVTPILQRLGPSGKDGPSERDTSLN